jgi:hypothetical protein
VDRDRGPAAGFCGRDDEPSCSMGEFLGQLSGYKLLKDSGSVVLVGDASALQRPEIGTSVLRMV